MQMALELRVTLEHWWEAGTAARLLREVHLHLGELEKAKDYAEKGIQFADRTGKRFPMMGLRAAKAQVLFYMGLTHEAEACFVEAEAIEMKRRPQHPVLTYIWGFWYCELLLDRVEKLINQSLARLSPGQRRKSAAVLKDVQRRAKKTLALWKKQDSATRIPTPADLNLDSVLDRANADLTLGRALVLEARLSGGRDFGQAPQLLDQAVEGLRQTGQQHHLVGGLLVRARFRCLRRDFKGADADLQEATGIVERSEMVIHQIDVNLEYARLFRAQKCHLEASQYREKAINMIKKTGYNRRDGEL
jgi:tetratricopeptide (TPR) repeat protein